MAFLEKHDEMDTDPVTLPSDDEVIATLAADLGTSSEETEEALDAVFLWQFNAL